MDLNRGGSRHFPLSEKRFEDFPWDHRHLQSHSLGGVVSQMQQYGSLDTQRNRDSGRNEDPSDLAALEEQGCTSCRKCLMKKLG